MVLELTLGGFFRRTFHVQVRTTMGLFRSGQQFLFAAYSDDAKTVQTERSKHWRVTWHEKMMEDHSNFLHEGRFGFHLVTTDAATGNEDALWS